MIKIINKKYKEINLAQAASELAIFGAILLFIIGLVLRTGLNSSHSLNAKIRAQRTALTMSYRAAEGQYGGIAARGSANVFILEDRLSVSADKLGARDRFPLMASQGATMSKNLYYPVDWGELENLGQYDVFVNGQHFPFSLGDMLEYRLAEDDGTQPAWIPACPNTNSYKTIPYSPPFGLCWQFPCVGYSQWDPVANGTHNQVIDAYGAVSYELAVPPNTGTHSYLPHTDGCTIMYRMVGNYPASEYWCDSDPCDANNANSRFDLDFDGLNIVPPALRDDFIWQWLLIPAVADSFRNNLIIPGIDNATTRGIAVGEEAINTNVDVDGDMHHEAVLTYNHLANSGVISRVFVIDSQEGDLNMAYGYRSPGDWKIVRTFTDAGCPAAAPTGPCSRSEPDTNGPNVTATPNCATYRCLGQKVGLQDNIMMLSETKGGTYLRLEAGNLFNPLTEQFVRKTNRQDHVDVIQRAFYITRDTDRFCDENSWVRPWGGGFSPLFSVPSGFDPLNVVPGTETIINPVEACNNCFIQAKINLTCMDEAGKVIFIRSRLEDMRGRRWVTRFE